MELPILSHLPLSEIPRRIVLQFLRKPHPTALLINSLSFARDTIELDIDEVRDYLSISGEHVCIFAHNWSFTPGAINCSYDATTGEHDRTEIRNWIRMYNLRNQLRVERGLSEMLCPYIVRLYRLPGTFDP